MGQEDGRGFVTDRPSRSIRDRGMNGSALLPTLLLLLVGGLPACLVVHTNYGDPIASDAEVEALVVGVTTRRQVLDALGPPEEYRQPMPWVGRHYDPQRQRVSRERDIFDRRRYTYLQERRKDRLILVLPVLTLFSSYRIDHQADRMLIWFDENDRVSAVSHQREGPVP